MTIAELELSPESSTEARVILSLVAEVHRVRAAKAATVVKIDIVEDVASKVGETLPAQLAVQVRRCQSAKVAQRDRHEQDTGGRGPSRTNSLGDRKWASVRSNEARSA